MGLFSGIGKAVKKAGSWVGHRVGNLDHGIRVESSIKGALKSPFTYAALPFAAAALPGVSLGGVASGMGHAASGLGHAAMGVAGKVGGALKGIGSAVGGGLKDTFMKDGHLDIGRVIGAGGAVSNLIGAHQQRQSAQNYNNSNIDARNALMKALLAPQNYNLPQINQGP